MNKSHLKPNLRFGFFFGICAAVGMLFSTSSEARTYDTMVTIYDYYGIQGTDLNGNNIYAAKVMHSGEFYHVEMLTPMPCLNNHRYEKAKVTITKEHTCYMDVEFKGHTARVHKVTKIESKKPAYSDFYHDTAAQDHRHPKKEVKPWMPFKFWD